MAFDVFYESFIVHKGYRSVLQGLGVTILTAVSALIVGVVIGTLVAMLFVKKDKGPVAKALSVIAKGYVGFFRGTPVAVQLLFIYFVIFPAIGLGLMSNIIVGLIIFGLNSGAYVTEIMRAALLSVDAGQEEAGRSLGLSSRVTMMRIVFPQAVKNAVPTIANEFIALLKETSVLSFIGVNDLTRAFREIASSNYEYTIPYLVLAVCYLLLVLGASAIIKQIEKRMRASDKR